MRISVPLSETSSGRAAAGPRRHRSSIGGAAALLLLTLLAGPAARSATAATVAAWDVNTMPGGASNFGASPLAATSADAHVTVGGLARGSGVGTSGTGAARGWGGNTFTSTTQAAAIAANQFATFTVTAATGFRVSFSSISTFDYRRSTTGAASGRLQYQIGAGAFIDGASLNYSSTATTGASLGPIDLSTVAALQNVPSGTVVTFRVVSWGGTSAAGTWYVFDRGISTASDLEVQGTVSPAATSLDVETAPDGTGAEVPAQTVLNGHGITVYAVSRDAGGGFAGNPAATWSLAAITGGVVAGDLVPSGDGKSAVFTAHAQGSAAIHATVAGLASTDSGVIAAQGPQSDPSASGLATPSTVSASQPVLLEVGVVPGSNPSSTGLAVTGDLSSLGMGASVPFHDDGLDGDLAAGDHIFSVQVTLPAAVAGGSKSVAVHVQDLQERSTTTAISLRVLGSVTIFHVNDTHARLTPHKWIVPSHAPMSSVFEDVGGAAYLASAILQSTAADANALVIDAGDISEGNPLGDMGGNLSMVQFYDMLSIKLLGQRGRGMDAVVVGNHDVRDVSYITHLDELHQSGVPIISVNVRDISTHLPHFAPYTIVTVNGTKIGILGYTTQSAAVGASLSTTLEVADCDWNSADATKIHLATYVNELRSTQGCDLVVLATHVGHSALATDTTVDGTASAALLVDDGVTKLPEVAVTGHWHTWAETVWQPASLNYKTIFTEAGSYMHYLGELHVDGRGNYVSSTSHVIRDAAYTPDPEVQAFVTNLTAQYDAAHTLALDAVLGYTADDLLLDERMKWWSSDEYPWSGNNSAGQWIADAVRWKSEQLFGQCDLSFEVGGGVRSDIPAGPVTYVEAYETFPWSDDTFSRVNMTGQEILNFLKVTNCNAAFSRALHVVAHDGVPTTVTFNGQPLDLAHTYTVGITNYIYDHPPAGWAWSDLAPVTSPVLARDGIVEFMQQYPASNPYTVGGPRYELDTQFSGQYRGVVTMMNDNDTKPVFEDAFLRLLSATPETLERRGTAPVPSDLVNLDGTINQSNRLAEAELYRSYLGFKLGALLPGDIVEVSGKGSFFGGNPEFVDQEGIYANGVEFKIVGHDASLAKPIYLPSIGSLWDDAHKNHYVQFLARKASANTVTDQLGTTIKLWDATGFAAKAPVPGAVNDLLLVSGIPTMESYALRFRCNTVDLAASKGITDYPAASTVSAQVQPLSPEGTGSALALQATAGADAPTRNLAPAADAQVSSTNPSTNYGATSNIFIQSAASGFGNERGWLRFDLSTLPSNAVITSAALEMYCWKATGASLDTEVHGGTSDTWVESSINFGNQPTFGPTIATQTLAAGNINVWYDWDVTSFVQTKWAGNKLVSLLVKPTVEGSTASTSPSYGFDAKEFGSNTPVLRVTTQSAGATVAQTEFFYRYSVDGVTWGAWTSAGVDTTAPYSTLFSYPQGYGYYEFYSIATDTLGSSQGAPPAAQAFVHHEPAPGYTTEAVVALGDLSQTYTGAPRAASVTTVPPALAMDVRYDGSTPAPVHAGSYAVAATVIQPGYTGAAIGTLTVAKASQTVTFAALAPIPVGNPPLTLTGLASSGLPVTFTSTNPAVATVSGNILTILAVGSTNIVAAQTGSGDFTPASPVSQALVVRAAASPSVPAVTPAGFFLLAILLVSIGTARLSRSGVRGLFALALLVGMVDACGGEPSEIAGHEDLVQGIEHELDDAAAANPAAFNSARPVRPVVTCVDRLAGNQFKAHFGYVNSSSSTISIPVSFFNRFWPAPINRGQPTTFAPGSRTDVVELPFAGFGATVWVLGSRFAIATKFSRPCPMGGTGGATGTGGNPGDGGARACPSSCDDHNPCTFDTCSADTDFRCVNASVPDGSACDDGNACTSGDACQSGVCTGGAPVVCPTPTDPCRLPGTCNAATGQCAPVLSPDGSACSSGANRCHVLGVCEAGVCLDPAVVDCGLCDQCSFGVAPGQVDVCSATADGCFNCNPDTDGCASITDAADRFLCENLFACLVAPSHPGTSRPGACIIEGDPTSCWCGTNPVTCLTDNAPPTQANGPCLQQILAAGKSADAGTIRLRFVNPNFPLGRAINLAVCQSSFCAPECGVPF